MQQQHFVWAQRGIHRNRTACVTIHPTPRGDDNGDAVEDDDDLCAAPDAAASDAIAQVLRLAALHGPIREAVEVCPPPPPPPPPRYEDSDDVEIAVGGLRRDRQGDDGPRVWLLRFQRPSGARTFLRKVAAVLSKDVSGVWGVLGTTLSTAGTPRTLCAADMRNDFGDTMKHVSLPPSCLAVACLPVCVGKVPLRAELPTGAVVVVVDALQFISRLAAAVKQSMLLAWHGMSGTETDASLFHVAATSDDTGNWAVGFSSVAGPEGPFESPSASDWCAFAMRCLWGDLQGSATAELRALLSDTDRLPSYQVLKSRRLRQISTIADDGVGDLPAGVRRVVSPCRHHLRPGARLFAGFETAEAAGRHCESAHLAVSIARSAERHRRRQQHGNDSGDSDSASSRSESSATSEASSSSAEDEDEADAPTDVTARQAARPAFRIVASAADRIRRHLTTSSTSPSLDRALGGAASATSVRSARSILSTWIETASRIPRRRRSPDPPSSRFIPRHLWITQEQREERGAVALTACTVDGVLGHGNSGEVFSLRASRPTTAANVPQVPPTTGERATVRKRSRSETALPTPAAAAPTSSGASSMCDKTAALSWVLKLVDLRSPHAIREWAALCVLEGGAAGRDAEAQPTVGNRMEAASKPASLLPLLRAVAMFPAFPNLQLRERRDSRLTCVSAVGLVLRRLGPDLHVLVPFFQGRVVVDAGRRDPGDLPLSHHARSQFLVAAVGGAMLRALSRVFLNAQEKGLLLCHKSVKLENFCVDIDAHGNSIDTAVDPPPPSGEGAADNAQKQRLSFPPSTPLVGLAVPIVRLIDFGRATAVVTDPDASRRWCEDGDAIHHRRRAIDVLGRKALSVEDPFTGWYYSDRARVGLPHTQLDDVTSAVWSIASLSAEDFVTSGLRDRRRLYERHLDAAWKSVRRDGIADSDEAMLVVPTEGELRHAIARAAFRSIMQLERQQLFYSDGDPLRQGWPRCGTDNGEGVAAAAVPSPLPRFVLEMVLLTRWANVSFWEWEERHLTPQQPALPAGDVGRAACEEAARSAAALVQGLTAMLDIVLFSLRSETVSSTATASAAERWLRDFRVHVTNRAASHIASHPCS